MRFLVTSILFFPSLAFSDAYIFHAGPEVYYCKRLKEGGSKQTGRIDGVRFTVERFKAYGLYVGLDAFVASGKLRGKSSTGRPLVSRLDDLIYEGRLGFTLQNCRSFITPFAGYGRFHERNAFRPPSRLPCTYDDTFNYTLVGFLTGLNFTPLLSMGFNFETKFMVNGTSKVTNDPDFDDINLIMNKELQARVEFPLVYSLTNCLSAELVPFYEFRHFGGREDFPFDFIDTKFHLIGLRFSIGGSF